MTDNHVLGITAYGCTRHEAALFKVLDPRFGVRTTVTDLALSDASVELAVGDRCVSVGHKTPVSHAVLRALSRCGVAYLSTRSVGVDHIDVPYASDLGITVQGVSYSPDSVADYTVMLILMSVRHTKSTVLRADAHDYRLHDVRGRELRDLTVGVIGRGRIGTAVVRRLQGFGGKVLTHDVGAHESTSDVALEELLRHSDVVSLHIPLGATTHHLLDSRRLGLMKRGAVVVNTARGGLIDTEALVAALDAGHLGGAALDVVEGEEGIFYADLRGGIVRNEPLLRLQSRPNVFISPHTAFDTDHAMSDMVEQTILGCLRFEKQESAWTG